MSLIEEYRVIPSTQVEEIYRTAQSAIRRLSSTSTSLIKIENWTAVCFHECLLDFPQISSAFKKYGYEEIVVLSWGDIEMSAFILPTSEEKMGSSFFDIGALACLIFSGKPDWLILYERTLDYLLICGKQDFVEEVLGCAKNDAFESIEETIAESGFISDVGKGHFRDLLYKLKVVYLDAEPGAEIIFEFT